MDIWTDGTLPPDEALRQSADILVRHFTQLSNFRAALTEPEKPMVRRLQKRILERRPDAKLLRAPAEDLPFNDDSFDTVVATLVLCTVDDQPRALRELCRVLRPGGRLLFIEHVREGAPRLARRQDRLAGPWRAFAQGCRCNQPTLELLERQGLDVVELARASWRGMPSVVRPLVVGHAA